MTKFTIMRFEDVLDMMDHRRPNTPEHKLTVNEHTFGPITFAHYQVKSLFGNTPLVSRWFFGWKHAMSDAEEEFEYDILLSIS